MQARANFFEIKIIASIRTKVPILSISSEIFNSKYLICYRAKNTGRARNAESRQESRELDKKCAPVIVFSIFVIVCNSVIYEPLLLNFCDKA